MTKIRCEVRGLSQRFKHFYLFKDISFSVSSGEIWMVKGKNGTGKSTLLKILTGAMEGSAGEVVYYQEDALLDSDSVWKHVSLVAPYQELPEELSLKELVDLQINMSGKKLLPENFKNLIALFEMGTEIHKPLAHYSTGMKQKAKIVIAIGEKRPILFLDEPTSNLDPVSFEKFWKLIAAIKKDRLIIIASNDEKELGFGKILLEL